MSALRQHDTAALLPVLPALARRLEDALPVPRGPVCAVPQPAAPVRLLQQLHGAQACPPVKPRSRVNWLPNAGKVALPMCRRRRAPPRGRLLACALCSPAHSHTLSPDWVHPCRGTLMTRLPRWLRCPTSRSGRHQQATCADRRLAALSHANHALPRHGRALLEAGLVRHAICVGPARLITHPSHSATAANREAR